MKISDLANLVIVRNHILTVLGDTSATNKTNIRALNLVKRQLDNVFVDNIQLLDFDNLFPSEPTPGWNFPTDWGTPGSVPFEIVNSEVSNQLELPLEEKPKKKRVKRSV